MSPQLNCGDYVVLLTLRYKKSGRFIRPGQRLVFDHPQYGRMIKEVLCINSYDNTFTAKGLNSESVSPEQIGPVSFESVIGKMIYAIKRPSTPASK